MKPIPKIIHRIWISKTAEPVPLPEKCNVFGEQFEKLHPDWEVRLHGNELWKRYGNDPFLKAYRSRPTCKEAHIVNRFRFLLLRDFGGFCVDADVEPLVAFDVFHKEVASASLVIGLLPQDQRSRQAADVTVLAAQAGSDPVKRVLKEAYQTPEWAPGGRPLANFILDHVTPDQRVVGSDYWFASEPKPDSIALHTPHRLRSWMTHQLHKVR